MLTMNKCIWFVKVEIILSFSSISGTQTRFHRNKIVLCNYLVSTKPNVKIVSDLIEGSLKICFSFFLIPPPSDQLGFPHRLMIIAAQLEVKEPCFLIKFILTSTSVLIGSVRHHCISQRHVSQIILVLSQRAAHLLV